MDRGGGSSRPNSFYSQTSTSSCCSLSDSRNEMRNLMDSFISDVQRIRESFDPSAAPGGQAASPVRNDGDVEMAPPVPGAYDIDRPSTPIENYEHKGIWCDSCSQKVMGVRHKCLDCYNYDLCNSCMTTKDIQSTHADMPHTFEAIYPPKPKPATKPTARPASRPSSPLPKCLCSVLPRPLGCEVCKPKVVKPAAPKRTPSYRCDSCQNIIGGTRHKCMSCPDFDLCEACYTAGFPVFDHSPVHRFMHIEHPVRVVTAPAMVVSDAFSPLTGGCIHEGPRYKCENCDDVDLCMSCLGNLERATIQHAAWHTERRMDQPVRFVPYEREAKPQTPTPTAPLAVHPAECDACDETIIGTRHKCTVCFNFDLCDKCYAARAQPMEHKTEHEMLHLERPQRIVTHVVGSERGPITRPVATSSTSTATPNALHTAWCDSCSERIRGVRHKCLDCPDFDYCNACIDMSSGHFNGEHQFYALAEPGQVVVRDVSEPARPRGRPNPILQSIPPPISAPPAPPVVPPSHQMPRPERPGPPSHSAACDMCSTRIRGVRYKCTACPDYDVCESCFRVSEEVHPGHSFAKVYKQGDIIVRKSPLTGFRHHARCDVCQKQILGVRYKCIHPSCPDFDICERCEAMPFAVHPETHAFVKLKSHVANYDGLKNVFSFAADRGQTSQPQPSTIRVPVPTVHIPTSNPHILPHVPLSRSPLMTYAEPMTGTEVFHTATPSPIVPLSTLGCTIVPHSTIVPSLPQTPEPPRAPLYVPSPPAIPSPIPSPPPIPVSLPTPERKLTDSWSAASSIAKLDEHKMHHSDMYKPSYEAPPVVPPRSLFEGQSRGRRTNTAESASPRHSVTVQEERDPEAPLMTLVNARPVSLPDVPLHEPVAIRAPSPMTIRVPSPEPIRVPSPESVREPSPEPVLVAVPEPVVVSAPESVVSASESVVTEPELVCVEPESESESESESVVLTIPEPVVVAVPEPVVAAPESELPGLLPAYPYRSRSPAPRSPIPDMVSLASSPSPSVSSASVVSYTSPFEAAFIEDKTIVDGQIVSGGAEFSKIWRMRNTGTVTWPQGTTISFVGGHYMTTGLHWAITGDLSPGQDIDVEVDMKAPEEPGQYVSTWRLKTPEGEVFGSPVWCDIIVAEIERAGSSGNSEVSASSIIVPTRAPGMSVATMSTSPASPEVQSITSTIRTSSVTDMADDDDDLSIDSDDSLDPVWEEVRRRGQGTSPH